MNVTTRGVFEFAFKDQIEDSLNISNLPFDMIKYETFLGNKILELFNIKEDQKLLYFYESGFEDYKDYSYFIYPDELYYLQGNYDISHYCKSYPVLIYFYFNHDKYPFNIINVEEDEVSLRNNFRLYEYIFSYQIHNILTTDKGKVQEWFYENKSGLSGKKFKGLLNNNYDQYILTFKLSGNTTRNMSYSYEFYDINTEDEVGFQFMYPDELPILYKNFTFSKMYFEYPIMNIKNEEFK